VQNAQGSERWGGRGGGVVKSSPGKLGKKEMPRKVRVEVGNSIQDH